MERFPRCLVGTAGTSWTGPVCPVGLCRHPPPLSLLRTVARDVWEGPARAGKPVPGLDQHDMGLVSRAPTPQDLGARPYDRLVMHHYACTVYTRRGSLCRPLHSAAGASRAPCGGRRRAPRQICMFCRQFMASRLSRKIHNTFAIVPERFGSLNEPNETSTHGPTAPPERCHVSNVWQALTPAIGSFLAGTRWF